MSYYHNNSINQLYSGSPGKTGLSYFINLRKADLLAILPANVKS
jgi:hypothetical protein